MYFFSISEQEKKEKNEEEVDNSINVSSYTYIMDAGQWFKWNILPQIASYKSIFVIDVSL